MYSDELEGLAVAIAPWVAILTVLFGVVAIFFWAWAVYPAVVFALLSAWSFKKLARK